MMFSDQDHVYMTEAIRLAGIACFENEVPIGALVVFQGKIVSKSYNQTISLCDPTAHAEILALREAAFFLGNYRLNGAMLFCTLEPCAMCCGAIISSRISRLVFAAQEPKTGCCGSRCNLLDLGVLGLNHHTQVSSGLLQEKSVHLMRTFFKKKRRERLNCFSECLDKPTEA